MLPIGDLICQSWTHLTGMIWSHLSVETQSSSSRKQFHTAPSALVRGSREDACM